MHNKHIYVHYTTKKAFNNLELLIIIFIFASEKYNYY